MKITNPFRELILFAEIKVDISKEHLLAFLSYLSPYVTRSVFVDGSLGYYTHAEGTTISFRISYSEDVLRFLDYLNTWGQVKSFVAEIHEPNSQLSEARIFLEGADYFMTTAHTENHYEDYGKEQDAFDTFKALCLRPSFLSEDGYFNACEINGLNKEVFLQALRKSDTMEDLPKQLITALATELDELERDVDFSLYGFYAELYVDSKSEETEENMSLKISEEQGLCISYDAAIATFKDKQKLSLSVPKKETITDVLLTHLPVGSRTEVLWDVLEDGEPLVTFLDKEYAKRVIFDNNECVKIQHKEVWVSPCSVCVNRLVMEIEGCDSCTFELV